MTEEYSEMIYWQIILDEKVLDENISAITLQHGTVSKVAENVKFESARTYDKWNADKDFRLCDLWITAKALVLRLLIKRFLNCCEGLLYLKWLIKTDVDLDTWVGNKDFHILCVVEELTVNWLLVRFSSNSCTKHVISGFWYAILHCRLPYCSFCIFYSQSFGP